MEQFDLVVIGSGPGGSAAAVAGLKRGLSVALVDKNVFPRDKLCGGSVHRAQRKGDACHF